MEAAATSSHRRRADPRESGTAPGSTVRTSKGRVNRNTAVGRPILAGGCACGRTADSALLCGFGGPARQKNERRNTPGCACAHPKPCIVELALSSVAQLAEHSTVNRRVTGSSPVGGARGPLEGRNAFQGAIFMCLAPLMRTPGPRTCLPDLDEPEGQSLLSQRRTRALPPGLFPARPIVPRVMRRISRFGRDLHTITTRDRGTFHGRKPARA